MKAYKIALCLNAETPAVVEEKVYTLLHAQGLHFDRKNATIMFSTFQPEPFAAMAEHFTWINVQLIDQRAKGLR